MQQKKIIIFIAILFIASSAWLFHASNKFLDPNAGKNWWTIEFQDPKSASLNFVLKNHSDLPEFQIDIAREEQPVAERKISVRKGEDKLIEIENDLEFQKEGRLTIRVTSGDEKREIYKNF